MGLPEILVLIAAGVILGAAMSWLSVAMAVRLARRHPPPSDRRRTTGGPRRHGG